MRRRHWIVLIATGLVVLASLILFSVVPLRRGYIPHYDSPQSIASLEQVTVGGSPHYILIRGEDTRSPILLNEFLKEHRKVEEQHGELQTQARKIQEQETAIA